MTSMLEAEVDVMWLQQAESKYQDEVPKVTERAVEGVPEVDMTCSTTASRSWREKEIEGSTVEGASVVVAGVD